jgi:hypothetical protein
MSDRQQPAPQWAVGPDWCGFSPPTPWGLAYGLFPKGPPGMPAP